MYDQSTKRLITVVYGMYWVTKRQKTTKTAQRIKSIARDLSWRRDMFTESKLLAIMHSEALKNIIASEVVLFP